MPRKVTVKYQMIEHIHQEIMLSQSIVTTDCQTRSDLSRPTEEVRVDFKNQLTNRSKVEVYCW